mgnify:CR=1 FL=1
MLSHWTFFLFLFTPLVAVLSIFFWAWLSGVLTAFGNRQWVWGTLMMALPPLVIPYSLGFRRAAAYPLRLLRLALLLLLIPLGYAATQGWLSGERPQLSRDMLLPAARA